MLDSNLGTVKIQSYGSHNGIKDVLPPSVSVLRPANGSVVSAGGFTVTGTARDNAGVASVRYRVDSGPWLMASGTTSWSASVPPTGVQRVILTVQALDISGSSSVLVKRIYTAR